MPIVISKRIKNRGFSLVEIMIALTLGIILTGFIMAIFANNKRAYNANNRVIELNSNMRFALSVIKDDFENAGFYGGLTADNIATGINTNNNCITTSLGINLSNASIYALWGKAQGGDSTLETACLTGITAGTDYVSIRGVRGSSTPDGSLDPNRVYIRINNNDGEFYAGNPGVNTNAANWKYYATIYYICQNRLLRQNLVFNTGTSLPVWNTEVLVGPALTGICDNGDVHSEAGIENMQVLYGVDSDQNGVANYYSDGNGITTADTWSNVVEVKISLLARSEIDNSFQDNNAGSQRTYQLGEQTITPASLNYHRSMISNNIMINNRWYTTVNDPEPL